MSADYTKWLERNENYEIASWGVYAVNHRDYGLDNMSKDGTELAMGAVQQGQGLPIQDGGIESKGLVHNGHSCGKKNTAM
jgi:hypothetical protein